MKHNILSVFAIGLALAAAAGCAKEIDPSLIDSATRISLDREIEIFDKDGKTASGLNLFEAAVTIVNGSSINSQSWDYELSDPKGCATVTKADITTQFTGSFDGDDRQVTEAGLSVGVSPNTEYRRTFDVVIIADDGTAETFTFTQLGEKPDAHVESETSYVEFVAGGGTYEINYTSNMGDVVGYSVTYDEFSSDWLTWTSEGTGKVVLSAGEWTDTQNPREAVFTITVGTEDTSIDTHQITVLQLQADIYYFMYGASVEDIRIENSIQMNKVQEGLYTISRYFNAAAKNEILFNKNSRTLSYPFYALASDGTVAEIASAGASIPEGPVVDIDGMRSLSVNFNDMTWTWERITTLNCMPDEEVANYPTKAYIARDGSYKTWMTVSLHWDGGSSMGTYKLGSGLVAGHQTGGYGNTGSAYLAQRIPDYDTEENGGKIPQVYAADGRPLSETKGRLYSGYEAITGTPTGCLAYYDLHEFLTEEYTDAVGNVIPVANLVRANLKDLSNEEAEALYPHITAQMQGICPYGWHIANLSDWMDLVYAAQVAAQGSEYEINATYSNYSNLASSQHLTNVGTILYDKDFQTYRPSLPRSSRADEFGFNIFCQGWRLRRTGYDYGPGDDNPRFYSIIPMRGQYTASKKAAWRVFSDGGNRLTIDDGFDFGNGCGAAIRCVKNYK